MKNIFLFAVLPVLGAASAGGHYADVGVGEDASADTVAVAVGGDADCYNGGCVAVAVGGNASCTSRNSNPVCGFLVGTEDSTGAGLVVAAVHGDAAGGIFATSSVYGNASCWSCPAVTVFGDAHSLGGISVFGKCGEAPRCSAASVEDDAHGTWLAASAFGDARGENSPLGNTVAVAPFGDVETDAFVGVGVSVTGNATNSCTNACLVVTVLGRAEHPAYSACELTIEALCVDSHPQGRGS